ncbi:MAG: multidrug efflux RND transporter permease subunit [Verrucomicrobiaceae bacterium]|nr:MAG: multidrug efflux RND transporter permease subunit [Verrucomicrobiaceae bacterium]
MNISHFFIARPIFASVLSIVIVIVGAVALVTLPIAQYPEITPPTVQVATSYPGADAQTVAETIGAPIEQQVNGVENMLYMSSQSNGDGSYALNITFKLGTNLDTAQVLVQNRVNLALPLLPEDVRRNGVSVKKMSSSMMMVVNLVSPDGRFDALYLGNYAILQLKDALARVNGVGDISIFGYEYSMRIWLDPEKLSARGLAAEDVVAAIREQNVQVAAGTIGAPPVPEGTAFQYTVTAQGRLTSPEQFEQIVVKQGKMGEIVRLGDIGRAELGAKSYSIESTLDGQPTVGLAIYQQPGGNAIDTAHAIRKLMEELKTRFPAGMEYRIEYDTTGFVQESITSVVHTLFEAIVLVILVVLVFLQSWRATVIPLIAVPVSLIGTFAAMAAFGFSLNNISLFGIVLAIGIVVDDAIVVVENVERNLGLGMGPVEAAKKAMDEVFGAVIAVALVLTAVFVPTAFITGISGEFYRQFALTIAVSTIISAFNSVTLSPALAALLLQPHGAKKDLFTRFLDGALGWFFRGFNAIFEKVAEKYGGGVARLTRMTALISAIYLGLLVLTGFGFLKTPVGFIPQQDKGYLIANVQLPDASTINRTRAVSAMADEILRKTHGVAHTLVINGMSVVSGANLPNAATIFVILDEFSERKSADLSGPAIARKVNAALSKIPQALMGVFGPPPVDGLGSTGGFRLMVQDRGGMGYNALEEATQSLVDTASKDKNLAGVFTSFSSGTPQLFVDIDRVKAKTLNVPLSNIFSTLQISLGSAYVNDITLFGRSFQVNAQADSRFRVVPSDILQLQARSNSGAIVPLATLASVTEITAPASVTRYNLYPAADVVGSTAPGVSSGQAVSIMENLATKTLPRSMGFEWTDLTYQQILAGNVALFVFPLCVLFVFLTLAAQYESWSLPMAIILIVPMSLLSSIGGVLMRRMDNNIFTQIGFIVLVGLACKNAILIVEFAKQLEDAGKDRFAAVTEACRLRLRPILMTSFAFILGVVPLVLASGPGAEMRQALGTAVFFGMLGVTFFGIFLTPVFYVIIRKFSKKKESASAASSGRINGPFSAR